MTFIPLVSPLNFRVLGADALDAAFASPPFVERFARTDGFVVFFGADEVVAFTGNGFFVLAICGLLQCATYGSRSAIPQTTSGVQAEHDGVFKDIPFIYIYYPTKYPSIQHLKWSLKIIFYRL